MKSYSDKFQVCFSLQLHAYHILARNSSRDEQGYCCQGRFGFQRFFSPAELWSQRLPCYDWGRRGFCAGCQQQEQVITSFPQLHQRPDTPRAHRNNHGDHLTGGQLLGQQHVRQPLAQPWGGWKWIVLSNKHRRQMIRWRIAHWKIILTRVKETDVWQLAVSFVVVGIFRGCVCVRDREIERERKKNTFL